MVCSVPSHRTVKPGRFDDAVADMKRSNEVLGRHGRPDGMLFTVVAGPGTYGGVQITWDYPTIEEFGKSY